ncbi:hypothetical protein S7711_04333 [Stachybotrys chartarum IBT 7711]|uniref:LysM domain-containing protein n=1 Tax=Stachybotrys chartarum (strain CBS 109288 / IBT 7711) TaxID=1280523 RepID=A0A084AY45_STACB|nr:hypothetical protein S7711_04333 [Stachybotrys chartarum IBT 7711]KFA48152.1 hypothetical protein S40293_06902 [Stachybotrys chartarum IBT 40293]
MVTATCGGPAKEYCCTCATLLSSSLPGSASKEGFSDRRLQCCDRIICATCIQGNDRFATYCPYCQISSVPTPLPQGLKDPPSYTPVPRSGSQTADISDIPPPYTPSAPHRSPDPLDEKAALAAHEKEEAPDILHFLHHEHDSVASLSLRYGVPANALRQANNITSDHLLLGRRTVLIPGEYYKGGVSLSPRPVEGEEEELRKGKIRRFMTSCKVSDYDVALLYLDQSHYDFDNAVDAYLADEAWEREHSKDHGGKGKKAAKPHRNRGPFWRGL